MKESGLSRRLPPALLAVLLAASAAGLLCTRIGDYDDSILLVGARLVGAGLLPYRDFYTHYGPLGFSLQSVLSWLMRNPPLALRIGQSLFLVLLGALAFVFLRRVSREASSAWAGIVFSVALSSAALLPSFYGFAFTLAALGAFAMAQGAESPRAAGGWAGASGVVLAASALTRPAFAAYALLAILVVGIAVPAPGGRARRLPFLLLAFAAAVGGIWILLYHRIGVAEALDATVFFPQRIFEGGRRYREAAFLRAPLPLAFVFTSLLALVPLIWAAALPSRRSRALAAGGVLASGALPLWLRVSGRPERDGVLIALGAIAIVVLLIVLQRAALSESVPLRAAALFGLAAAAFEHYLWARADRPHFLLFLATGTAGAAIATNAFGPIGKTALLAFFFLAYAFFTRSPDHVVAPLESLWQGGIAATTRNARAPGATWKSIWPCEEVPADAVRAVSAADRDTDKGSRFVAVGSNQAFADQSPVLLFLLSARLPYTRWYQYDPGVQNSPAVQREMVDELERSGSLTAVVWFSEVYTGGSASASSAPLTRTPFDEAFDRLFPVRGPRYGLYEIRLRPESGESSPPR